MSTLHVHDLSPFPPGNNESDTLINSLHFNLTTLRHWNYTLYTNGTLSNDSECYLVFDQFKPLLLSNGTFVNATSCYVPIRGIESRGITGLVCGILFAASIVFTLVNLRKHGRSYLPREKRWKAVGRRWQWYWMLFVAACGIISTMTGIDVDRDYLQSTPLMLQSFFYTLMVPGLIASVWEATRHWGSWQERQICDADAFGLPQDDIRSRKEFYMPLVFYLFDWMLFFMTIPRPWSALQKQHSPEQIDSVALPNGTDIRFKAGSVLAFLAWCVICYCLSHSLRHYKQIRSSGRGMLYTLVLHTPPKLSSAILILAVRIGYAIASAWIWSISPYRASVGIGWLYGLGYGPALLMLILFNVYGFMEENDDRILIVQRARRDESADRALGINRASRKPSWWSKSHAKGGFDAEDMLQQMTYEIGGSKSSSDPRITSPAVDEDNNGDWWWQRRQENSEREGNNHGVSSSGSSTYVRGSSMLDSASSTVALRQTRESSAAGSDRSARSYQGRPQVVRSMLDV